MCEIFFIQKTDDSTISKTELKPLLKAVVEAGKSNSEGWGMFDENARVTKKPKQFLEHDINPMLEKYIGSKYLVIHTRKATNGTVKKENTHPFTKKKYLLVHNGIVSTDQVSIHDRTDSFEMLKAIVTASGKNTPQKIKHAMEKKVSGWFSVFLKDNNNLYYFRDTSSFDFHYYTEKNILIGATNINRIKEIYAKKEMGIFRETPYYLEAQPKPRTLYKITQNKIILLFTMKDNNNFYYADSGYYGGFWSDGVSYGQYTTRRAEQYRQRWTKKDYEGWEKDYQNELKETKAKEQEEYKTEHTHKQTSPYYEEDDEEDEQIKEYERWRKEQDHKEREERDKE